MKKTYQQPTIECLKIETSQMLAVSTLEVPIGADFSDETPIPVEAPPGLNISLPGIPGFVFE